MIFKNRNEPIYKEMRSLAPYFLVMGGVYFAITMVIAVIIKNYTLPLGAVYGLVLAVANFFVMGKSVQKALRKREEKAANTYMSAAYALRYLGLFVLLTLGALAPFINLITMVIPLFFPKLSIMVRTIKEREE